MRQNFASPSFQDLRGHSASSQEEIESVVLFRSLVAFS